MDILLVLSWNQHPCCHAVTWNQHFSLSRLKMTVFELTLCVKHFALFKWNQHLCCHALPWNQHFNLSRPEIDVFELTCCVKWPFSFFLKVKSTSLLSCVIVKLKILTYLGLKLPFLSLCAARNEHFALFKWNQHLCCHALPWIIIIIIINRFI